MKIEPSDLKLIAMIINEPGFVLIEKLIKEKRDGYNDMKRICGDAFKDGWTVGRVSALSEIMSEIKDIRLDVKHIGGRDD